MATIDVSALTLNAKEQPDFMKFVSERMYEFAGLQEIHGPIWTGLTMKEQIVFASLFGDSGIIDSSCTRPNSGGKAVFTEKFWEPSNIGDTLVLCQSDVNALFKAYYDKITSYAQKFDFTGSDEETFLATVFAESAAMAIRRLVWFGDKTTAEATASAAGVTAAAKVKFYTPINGLWQQIFNNANIAKVSLAENSQVTTALQLTLASGRSVEIFEEMWAKADPRLKADPNARFMVNGAIFENYRKWLQSQSLPFNPTYTTDGFASLTWNGKQVVNMEILWDLKLQADFVDNTTNNAYFLPNRALFTVPTNIPIGTLNEGDFTELDSWFEKKERQNYMAYGFTLDAKFLEAYMAVVAY